MYMLILGLEPTYLVSEQYRYPMLMGSAMPATCKNNPVASSIAGSRTSWPYLLTYLLTYSMEQSPS